MTDTIVLLHGGATGSSSWNPVARALVSSGASVFAPDMLGYGASPAPTGSDAIAEEVAHLTRLLGLQPYSCNGIIYAVGFGGTFHLVTHSLGSLIGLHLRRALGARVTRMTLVDPVVVSALRECGENDAYAEMEEQYQRFMSLSADHDAAAHYFVDHRSARGHSSRRAPRSVCSGPRSARRPSWFPGGAHDSDHAPGGGRRRRLVRRGCTKPTARGAGVRAAADRGAAQGTVRPSDGGDRMLGHRSASGYRIVEVASV